MVAKFEIFETVVVRIFFELKNCLLYIIIRFTLFYLWINF